MNLEEKRTRLKSLLEENIRAGKVGTAIAITGSWGVGKTYFWKKLLEEELSEERIYKKDNVFNRKYAYVSLFGLESLSDLKTNIYSNIENYHSTVEIPKWIKGLPSIFKDTKISQYGISAPAKVFDSLMFNQVKDAIICFDDFERMSNKLDIKDVMGLANQLKLEKNCQVILILDEDKTEDENKKKYAEYKEKLIDETIIINSVEPLIRANAQDMDEPLIELMVKFADELEIHNFRFFQKVIKLYKDFRKQLPSDVADSTKEIILIRILQGYLITDFGSAYELSWDDFTIKSNTKRMIDEKNNKDAVTTTNAKLNKLRNISYEFFNDDFWMIEFKKWFEQLKDFDKSRIFELARSDLINANNRISQDEFWGLWRKIWNYQCDDEFPKLFFESSIKNIGLLSLGNLDFAISILEEFGDQEKATLLETKVKKWIGEKLELDRRSFRGRNAFGHGDHRFDHYIDAYCNDNSLVGLPSFTDSMYAYFINQQYSDEHQFVISNVSKDELEKFIKFDFFQDDRFINTTLAYLLEKLSDNRKQHVIEILEERGQTSNFHKKYTDYLIAQLEHEKKES